MKKTQKKVNRKLIFKSQASFEEWMRSLHLVFTELRPSKEQVKEEGEFITYATYSLENLTYDQLTELSNIDNIDTIGYYESEPDYLKSITIQFYTHGDCWLIDIKERTDRLAGVLEMIDILDARNRFLRQEIKACDGFENIVASIEGKIKKNKIITRRLMAYYVGLSETIK